MFLDKGDILGYRIIEEKIKTKTANPGSFVSGEAQKEIGWLDKPAVEIRAGGAVSKKLLGNIQAAPWLARRGGHCGKVPEK